MLNDDRVSNWRLATALLAAVQLRANYRHASVLHCYSMMTDLMLRIASRLTAAEWHAEAWPDTCPACTQTREVGHRADCWLDMTLTDLRAARDEAEKVEADAILRGRDQRYITADERLLVVPG